MTAPGDCDCGHCQWLLDERLKYAARGAADRPVILSDAVDEDGMVTRVRMLGWEELLDAIERSVAGDVDAS